MTTETKGALVILESPAKARTVEKFLGNGYEVEASIGHIRDLPKGTKDLPAEYKKESWARLGVNVDHNFDPIYVISADKVKQIKKLKDLLKKANAVYLATDEDREGEAISWHLLEVLKPKVPVHRLVFHEITKEAIMNALAHPREIDIDLVRAQETRRIVDRLFGYEISPLLWFKIRPSLSAGRVQSVAVRLIVERERERIGFHSADYWSLLGNFLTDESRSLSAALVSVGGKNIPAGKDFNPASGKLNHPEKFLLLDEQGTEELTKRLMAADPFVQSVEEKPYVTRPYPPFTTSTLQQEANRKLGFTARITMSVAQSLYENGFITYMRTDSTNLSREAIDGARRTILSLYGSEYLPSSPRYYQTKVKNAQEAHEAIRPAGSSFTSPSDLRSRLSADEYKLYDLIWKRTVACQMNDARGRRKSIEVALDDALFHVSGKTIDFPGYLRAYVEGHDDPNAELADQETILPNVQKGEKLKTKELTPQKHSTVPPARYSEAALTRTLEEKGIGRPSTFAAIIDTILNRQYVFKKNGVLIPTWTAFAVCQLLEAHFSELIDYHFTAEMENQLDAISRGELEHIDYLKRFYFGDEPKNADSSSVSAVTGTSEESSDANGEHPLTDHPGLKALAVNKASEIDARDVSRIYIGTPKNLDGTDGEPIYVRVGRFGPFLQQGERQAGVPEDLPPDELTVAKALELFETTQQNSAPLGVCPETNKNIYLKNGRFGPYVQRGENDDPEKPQNASLIKGMQPQDVTLEIALALLSLPRHLGTNPENNEEVIASNGRFGPYVKCGTETRSLTGDYSPLTIDLSTALELLAKPKFSRKREPSKKSEPLKVFDNSPVTGNPVHLLNGRFGPYVTDGTTNASLPRDLTLEELTFEKALELLEKRAARGPVTRGRGRKAAVKKTAAAKSAKKKTESKTAKKTAKKAVKKAVKKTAVKKTVKKAAAKKAVKKSVKSVKKANEAK